MIPPGSGTDDQHRLHVVACDRPGAQASLEVVDRAPTCERHRVDATGVHCGWQAGRVTSVRAHIVSELESIEPFDELERAQRADAIAWARSGGPLCRIAKPATPPKHLVAYAAVVDLRAQHCLLVDHRLAGLWLPPGGHVELDELPVTTVFRESVEELGVEVRLVSGLSSNPLFVTQATTVGTDAGHIDVSLWYACEIEPGAELRPDEREFHGVRWWPFAEILAADPARLDPNLPRFIEKLMAAGNQQRRGRITG